MKVENKQILLCNSNRNQKDFLKSLKIRLNGEYKKIPNYLIDKSGKVHNLNKKDVTSHYLDGYTDKGVVIICLENIGWLKKRSKAAGRLILDLCMNGIPETSVEIQKT